MNQLLFGYDFLEGLAGCSPEELLEAMNAALPIAIENLVGGAKAVGRDFVWLWLHKGMDTFMSCEQYREFYWPTLKGLLMGLIENGLTPIVYTEGSYNTRLEILQDVPVGKVVYHFEDADMARAKDVLKGIACISGNLSATLLSYGTPDDVIAETKKLIDICGKDGGYMFDTNALVDNAKPENVKAMFDTVKEYGRYS